MVHCVFNVVTVTAFVFVVGCLSGWQQWLR